MRWRRPGLIFVSHRAFHKMIGIFPITACNSMCTLLVAAKRNYATMQSITVLLRSWECPDRLLCHAGRPGGPSQRLSTGNGPRPGWRFESLKHNSNVRRNSDSRVFSTQRALGVENCSPYQGHRSGRRSINKQRSTIICSVEICFHFPVPSFKYCNLLAFVEYLAGGLPDLPKELQEVDKSQQRERRDFSLTF